MFRSQIAEHRTVKDVEKCIYCGATENLHDEHCIPESLNGNYVLGKGSCSECGRITSRFEGKYARDSVLAVRTALNMKSKRSKTKRPTEFPMRIKKGDQEEIINVPIEDHYSVIPMVQLGQPARYKDQPHAEGLPHKQWRLVTVNIRPEHIDYLVEKYGADEISVDFDIDVTGFLRLIAKIAYCMTVQQFGLSSIAEAYVVPGILGTKNDIWEWVESDGTQELREVNMNTDHLVTGWFTPEGELECRVKLFKKSLSPEYHVIVGRLTEAVHGFYQSIGRR